MTYRFNAQLTCKEKEGVVTEVNHYKRFFFMELLKETSKNATIYDKELNMHFETSSASTSVYEVETKHVTLDVCERLKKLEDLTRRMNYRYDWIQVKVDEQGKVLGIENKEELRMRWQRLKKNILADYQGDAVEAFIEKIDADFGSLSAFLHVNQYFQLGLLFPHIPLIHKADWENKRIVKISEYEDETFEEHIRYEKTEDGWRYYQLTGKTANEQENLMVIDGFNGTVIMPENSLFPIESQIVVVFHTKVMDGEWRFKLIKI